MDNSWQRKIILKQRQQLTLEEVKQLSSLIFDKLQSCAAYRSSQHIAMYIDVRHEVMTRMILIDCIQNKKHVYVPRVSADHMSFYEICSLEDLECGHFGIPEPRACCPALHCALDVMLVPLVMFDSQGNRLGMGGGYYDRYLAVHPCPTIGLAYAFQKGKFAVFDHDQPLDQVITEDNIWTFSRR